MRMARFALMKWSAGRPSWRRERAADPGAARLGTPPRWMRSAAAVRAARAPAELDAAAVAIGAGRAGVDARSAGSWTLRWPRSAPGRAGRRGGRACDRPGRRERTRRGEQIPGTAH